MAARRRMISEVAAGTRVPSDIDKEMGAMLASVPAESEKSAVRAPAKEAPKEKAEKTVITIDSANEGFVIGYLASDSVLFGRFAREIVSEHFAARENREAWDALLAMHRQKLEFTPAAIEVKAGAAVARHIAEMADAVAGAPHNVDWHVRTLIFDSARMRAARTTVPALVDGLKDPTADADKMRTLARAVLTTFTGFEDRKYLVVPEPMIERQIADIRARANRSAWGYGIDSLDFYEKKDNGEIVRRMNPGPERGQVTVVTGVSGGGKTTVTSNIVLGLRRVRRKVLYGAWEMNAGTSLELLATIDLGFSRSRVRDGIVTEKQLDALRDRMHELSEDVLFLDNPFQRTGGDKRKSNDYNLDKLQSYILESGADVFIGDLWKRCLTDASTDAEEDALYRQQAMAHDGNYHAILLQQQRLKDVEQRPDKRPTREGIKGSGAWVEVADTIIGCNRPSLWKDIPDDTLELIILKQRYGAWPLVVEFDWDADRGKISDGRSLAYRRPGEADENEIDAAAPVRFGGRKRFGK
jgi:replicative DNA helicase